LKNPCTVEKRHLIKVYIIKLSTNQKELKLSNGLVQGHAYIVTKMAELTLSNGRECRLIRLYNPWGNDVEWNGEWSDKLGLKPE
jgi:hypothetical protein